MFKNRKGDWVLTVKKLVFKEPHNVPYVQWLFFCCCSQRKGDMNLHKCFLPEKPGTPMPA